LLSLWIAKNGLKNTADLVVKEVKTDETTTTREFIFLTKEEVPSMPNALSYLLVSRCTYSLSSRGRKEKSQIMHDDMMTHAFLSLLEHDYVLRFLLVLVLCLSSSLSRERATM
jgi:hypothetical protein